MSPQLFEEGLRHRVPGGEGVRHSKLEGGVHHQREVREALARGAGSRGRLAGLGGPARLPEKTGLVGARPREATLVVELPSHARGLAEACLDALELAERPERGCQLEAEVGPELRRLAGARQPLGRRDRLIEQSRRVFVCGPPYGDLGCPAQSACRLRPRAGFRVMRAQRGPVRLEPPRIVGLEGARHRGVEEPPAGRQQLRVADLAEVVVGEREAIAGRVQDAVARHLLHLVREGALGHARGAPQERRLDLAPDHRGHRHERAAARAQPIQPPHDDLPDSIGQRQPFHRVETPSRRDAAHRLDDHERIALAEPPHASAEPRHVTRRCASAGQLLDEGERLGRGQRREPQRRPLRVPVRLEEASRRPAVHHLLRTHGRDEQEP